MLRFFALFIVAVLIGLAFLATVVCAISYFNIYPLDNAGRLELLKLAPATLAFLASLFAAAVSILSVQLQRRAARTLELLKSRSELTKDDIRHAKQLVDRAIAAASNYHNELKQLEVGNFDLDKVSAAEREVLALGDIMPRDTACLGLWYRFSQQGFCIVDVAKRRNAKRGREDLWNEEGVILGQLFTELLKALNQERSRIGAGAFETDLPRTAS